MNKFFIIMIMIAATGCYNQATAPQTQCMGETKLHSANGKWVVNIHTGALEWMEDNGN